MTKKQGHHLILGKLADCITGEIISDTHDERYRQKLAYLLLNEKGFFKKEIEPRRELTVIAGEKRARVKIDFCIILHGKIGMIVKYAPGSLITRHRPAVAASRLVAPYQVPMVVVTNGEDAHIIEGRSGKAISTGMNAIPSKKELETRTAKEPFYQISAQQAEMEARIFYAFEIDGSCPCDDTICRL